MISPGPDALPQAFFLQAEPGQRFCLYHAPQGDVLKGRVLYLHPFAEEMNASRRVVAQQCRALAASGFAVLQIDLFGCGDSTGDFADASWLLWQQDALLGLNWLQQQGTASAPLWLWGLRAGALLACDTARQLAQAQPELAVNLLLWQPMASGQQQLQQFLRLHAAAQWLGREAAGEAPAQALAAGRHAHVAGYSLSPTLATELSAASLAMPAYTQNGWVELLELPAAFGANAPSATPSPWAQRQQVAWQAAGWQVGLRAEPTHGFWQNVVESALPANLQQATLAALAAHPATPSTP